MTRDEFKLRSVLHSSLLRSPPAAALLLARGWLQLGYILPSELQTPVFECVVRPPHERGLSLPRLYKSVSMQLFFLLLGGRGLHTNDMLFPLQNVMSHFEYMHHPVKPGNVLCSSTLGKSQQQTALQKVTVMTAFL